MASRIAQARDQSLDFVKFIAISLVIVVHLSAPVFVSFGNPLWMGGAVWRGVSSICVPLFFLAIGAVLLKKDATPLVIYRRIVRAAVPLFLWSLIYLSWDKYANHVSTHGWISKIFATSVSDLWFMYALIGLYLFLPIVSLFDQHASAAQRTLFLIAWFVGASVNPLFGSILGRNVLGIDFSYAPLYAGYVILGSTIYTWIRTNRSAKVLALSGACAVLALVSSIGVTEQWSSYHHAYTMMFFEYASPLTVIASAASFIALQLMFDRITFSWFRRIVKSVSKRTLGIYLSQMLVLHAIFFRDFYFLWQAGSWIWIPVGSLLILAVCTALVAAIERVPILRYLCPE
jgi:surface polysaccharide O-acyltransferase-like enzyme